MNVKKVNRLCTVKGCKNTASYAISRSSEYGGIIICKDCLSEALEAVLLAEEKGLSKLNTNTAREKSTAALFYHPEKTAEEKAAGSKEQKESGALSEGNKKSYVCTECGKACSSAAGLKKHMNTHKDGDEK